MVKKVIDKLRDLQVKSNEYREKNKGILHKTYKNNSIGIPAVGPSLDYFYNGNLCNVTSMTEGMDWNGTWKYDLPFGADLCPTLINGILKTGYHATILTILDYFDYLFANVWSVTTGAEVKKIFGEIEMYEVKMT